MEEKRTDLSLDNGKHNEPLQKANRKYVQKRALQKDDSNKKHKKIELIEFLGNGKYSNKPVDTKIFRAL